MREFDGEWGGKWEFDPTQSIGDESGFGSVHPGKGAGRDIAVKVVPPGTRSTRLREREAEMAAKIRDAKAIHIVPILDLAHVNDELLLVMPRATESLAHHIRSGVLDMHEVLKIFSDIARSLVELHSIGIVHRDLKPANVLLLEGEWKLTDFGIAHDADLGTQTYTWQGAGTRQYLAPELFDLRSPTVQSDLYALGCIGFELLVGQPPFGRKGDIDAFRNAHRQSPVPALPASAPSRLKQVLIRLLRKDPAERYGSAAQVVERLEQIPTAQTAQHERISAALAAHAERAAQAEATSESYAADVDAMRAHLRALAADLGEMLDDALDNIQGEEPDIRLQSPGPTLGDTMTHWGTLGYPLWHSFVGGPCDLSIQVCGEIGPDVTRDDIVAVAAVGAKEPSSGQFVVLANLIGSVDDGKPTWSILRFRAQGVAASYPYGPRDREHGFDCIGFERARNLNMLGYGGYPWVIRRETMTAEHLVQLYAEALELSLPG